MPLWVFPAAGLFFGEKLTPWKLIGMVLGLAGLSVPASLVLGGLLILLGVAAIAIGDRRRH